MNTNNNLLAQLEEKLNIKLYPAGIWKFDSLGKHPIDVKRYDNLKWEHYPNDNMAKLRLDETPYIVIDVDSDIIDIVEKDFPATKTTFYTTTTKPYKRHYYLLPPESVSPKPLFRAVGVRGPQSYDILSTGILFELHGAIPKQVNPNYSFTKDRTPQRLTDEEWNKIKELTQFSQTQRPKNALYFNSRMRELIQKYLKEPLSRKEHNELIKLCTPSEYTQNAKTRKLTWPELNHDNFNKIAFIVFNNGAIDTEEEGLPFLEKLLEKEYKVALDSYNTQKHFYKSILLTLPRHPSYHQEENKDELTLKEQAALVKIDDNKGVIKFLSNKNWEYAVINLSTLDIVQYSQDSLFLNESSIRKLLNTSAKQFVDYHLAMPTVKLVNNPYKPKYYYDIDNDIACYNLTKQTRYYKEALASSQLNDSNIVYKLIKSYYGEYTELYLHWLAHTMFGSRSPHTVLLAVSPPETPAGTGKTLTTSSIPQRLIYAAQTVSEDVIQSGWGQVFLGKRLITLNDLRGKSIWSNYIYSEIRNKTTGGQRRQEQLKYGGFIEHTESVTFSVSANFLPPLDPHDRRCFVVLPQQYFGNTRLLTKPEAERINEMFENTPLDYWIPELQELANYLKYLYENERDKFSRELYIEAPDTKGRALCLKEGKGTARSLLSILSQYPDELSLEIRTDQDALISQNYIKNERDIVAFIVMQSDKGKAYLPWQFFSDVLALVQNERAGRKSSPAAVAASLGITKEQFKRVVSPSHYKYKDTKELARYSLNPRIAEWAKTNLLVIDVDEEWYKNRFNELTIAQNKEVLKGVEL